MLRQVIIIVLILSSQASGEEEETTVATTTSEPATTAATTTTTAADATTSSASTTTADTTASTDSSATAASTTTTTPNSDATTKSTPSTTTIPFPTDLNTCTAYQNWFNTTVGQQYTMKNGYYLVEDPSGGAEKLELFCDFFTDGGHWTAIQVRAEDEVGTTFKNGTFSDYENGFFMNTNGPSSYWLGLERILSLITSGQKSLRIDITSCGGGVYSAVYDNFKIESADSRYKLTSADFVASLSTAGDSLSSTTDKFNLIKSPFYTADSYNKTTDGKNNCAQLFGGGWWYNQCGLSNLNGIHYTGCYYSALFTDGIRWGSNWSGYYSPNRVEIKVRNPASAPTPTPAASTTAAAGSNPTDSTTAAATTDSTTAAATTTAEETTAPTTAPTTTTSETAQ